MLGYQNLTPKVETTNTIRIKICGITHPEDTLAAAETGADTVGLVLYVKNKRTVTTARAKEIAVMLPPFVSAVMLFVNERPGAIREILHRVPIDVIQFHGDESDDFCRQLDQPYLRAVRVQSTTNIQTICAKFPNARALLFDVYHPTEYGGTRRSFDWTMLSGDLDKPWILAGGLTPESVADAMRTSDAVAVGVSGGVENSAGVEDKEKMAAFVAAAKIV